MTQTALITGASGGIGYELAKLLAQDHYNLVLVARSEAKLHAIQQDLTQQYGVKVKVLAKDLAIANMAEEIFWALESEQTSISVLVNNAGFGDFGYFAETDWQKTANMLQVNVVALTQLTHLLLPGMVQRGQGKILNLASTAAFQPGPLMAVYYATKAYVLSFSEAIANELQGTGVTVTALCPGPTESGFQAAAAIEDSNLVKGKKLPTSAEVARFGYTALMSGKVVAIHGWWNWLMALAVRFLPRQQVTETVRKMQSTK
ncbi:MAG: SDR family oxidoreductase [Scytolyngbya sp. HA4215-MV1]|jgi:hypothetical protein|nr:SDR family oxidoreductase [Scytolyngbya sp. HA4215-MV1]